MLWLRRLATTTVSVCRVIVDEIIETARHKGADLIAMTSHERTDLAEAFHGSVAASVLHRIDHPLLVDPESEHITHLVVREGHLWGQRDVTIPISKVDRMEGNAIYLKLDKESVEALPTILVRR